MSFLRHGEIYRPMQKRERPAHDRPQPHRYDEFPAGYSLAGCAPAEPASPSPAITHSAGNALGSTIKMQRTANHLLTACLTQGDNPSSSKLSLWIPLRELGRTLLLLGGLLVILGALLYFGGKLPLRLGRLPGDIVHRGEHSTFYFPVVTCLVLSLALSLLFWLFSHFRR